jgi:hypothetical protein
VIAVDAHRLSIGLSEWWMWWTVVDLFQPLYGKCQRTVQRSGTWNITGFSMTFFRTTFSLIDYKRRSTRSTTISQKWRFTWNVAIDRRCRRSTKTGLKMVDQWWMWWMSKQAQCSAPLAELRVMSAAAMSRFSRCATARFTRPGTDPALRPGARHRSGGLADRAGRESGRE